MRVVRLHPGGMPATERYTISTVFVNRYVRGRHTKSCACGDHIGYAYNTTRGTSFEQAWRRCHSIRGDQAVVVTVINASVYSPYAGVTVFGSRRTQRYLAVHGHGGIVSCVDELEALHSARSAETFDAQGDLVLAYEASRDLARARKVARLL